jgi:hypothetical protein
MSWKLPVALCHNIARSRPTIAAAYLCFAGHGAQLIEAACWLRQHQTFVKPVRPNTNKLLTPELKRGGFSPDMNSRQILQGRHDKYTQTRRQFELQHPGEACCAEPRAR